MLPRSLKDLILLVVDNVAKSPYVAKLVGFHCKLQVLTLFCRLFEAEICDIFYLVKKQKVCFFRLYFSKTKAPKLLPIYVIILLSMCLSL